MNETKCKQLPYSLMKFRMEIVYKVWKITEKEKSLEFILRM